MTDPQRMLLAVRNNAAWCDTVCAAHGTPGVCDEAVWVCQHPAPRFYPNVVTLIADGHDAQREAIERLMVSLPGSWAVKDSFAALDLAPLGFTELFEAQWIWRPTNVEPPAVSSDFQWTRVMDADELGRWEQAWAGEDNDAIERTFLASLLDHPDIVFFAARQVDQIVGGVIANRSGDVVGLSNLFAPTGLLEEGWAGAVASIMNMFPGLPIVGYESGDDLAMAERCGFERARRLRIWGRS